MTRFVPFPYRVGDQVYFDAKDGTEQGGVIAQIDVPCGPGQICRIALPDGEEVLVGARELRPA